MLYKSSQPGVHEGCIEGEYSLLECTSPCEIVANIDALTLTPTKHEGRRGRAYCGVADRAEDRAAGKRERNGTVKI